MRIIRFRVEFLGHVLAGGRSGAETRDHFQRTSDNLLVFKRAWWYSAIAAALPDSGLRHITPDMIAVDPLVDAKTSLYRREYGYKDFRFHEAIMPGTVVCFRAAVSAGITKSNFVSLMNRLGSFVGLSPYGSKMGYGRFKLLDADVENEASVEGVEENGSTSEGRRQGSTLLKNT